MQDNKMTATNEMPGVIWVFNEPSSIGDLGFTRTDHDDEHDQYHQDIQDYLKERK